MRERMGFRMTLAGFTNSARRIGSDQVLVSAVRGLPTEARATGPCWTDRTTGGGIGNKASVEEMWAPLLPRMNPWVSALLKYDR